MQYKQLASRYAVAKDDPIFSARDRWTFGSDSGAGETHEALVMDAVSLFQRNFPQRTADAAIHPSIQQGWEARKKFAVIMQWPALPDGYMPFDSAESSASTQPSTLEGDATESGHVNESTSNRPSCPFAKMGGAKPPHHPKPAPPVSAPRSSQSLPNPVAVGPSQTACAAHPSPPPSATGSATKCPIRFLTHQSPEAVAEYLEKHKHEVPRSHEVCVKRHQTNTEDIRRLDAKYGSLVQMVQELGAKHQPLLPPKEDEEGPGRAEELTNERVESWARTVSGNVQLTENTDTKTEGRESRFDRPMNEVRLGESPSRPWGIPVPPLDDPINVTDPTGVDLSERSVAAAIATATSEPSRQEFLRGKASARMQEPAPQADIPDVNFKYDAAFLQQLPTTRARQSKMIFTGPVFIGYPMEQAMSFLQHHNVGKPGSGE